jgi:hypothetical protein
MSEEDYLKQEEHEFRRRARRRQPIDNFRKRQGIAREWIAVDEMVEWCSRSVTGVSAIAVEEARTLAYDRLDQSARNGEFETSCQGQTQSRILYLHPRMTLRGKDRRWLTRERLDWVANIRVIAAYCWLPREMARRWLVAHGYSWPAHFDPMVANSPAAGEPGPGPTPPPSSVEAAIAAEIKRLADWIFLQYPKTLGFDELSEIARKDSEVGTFKVIHLRAAHQAVYVTKRHRRPKEGWQLRSPYKERVRRAEPSRKS